MQLWNDWRVRKSSLAVNLWFFQDLSNHCQGQAYNLFFILCVQPSPHLPNFKSLLSALHSEHLCGSPFGGNDHLYGSHLAVWLKKIASDSMVISWKTILELFLCVCALLGSHLVFCGPLVVCSRSFNRSICLTFFEIFPHQLRLLKYCRIGGAGQCCVQFTSF